MFTTEHDERAQRCNKMQRVTTIASEMIPIRLIISITIIAAITVMIVAGHSILSMTLAEHQIESQCLSLESTLYTMVQSGVARDVDEVGAIDGTKRTYTLELPDSSLYLSFGVDPDPNNDGILETGLTSDGSVVCYQVSGGSKHVLWLSEDDIRFREGNYTQWKWTIHGTGEGLILTSEGTITLTFELIEKHHETYILIYPNDND